MTRSLCEYERLIQKAKRDFPHMIDLGWLEYDDLSRIAKEIREIVGEYPRSLLYVRLINRETRWLLTEYRTKHFEVRFRYIEEYVQSKLIL